MKLLRAIRAVLWGDLIERPERTWQLVFCDACGRPAFHWYDDTVTPCECGSRNASLVKIGELEKIRPIKCMSDRDREQAR